MKRSTTRILTTHTGSLPRPPEVLRVIRAREAGEQVDDEAFAADIRSSVADIVARQVEAGVAVVNDGECSKPSFNTYIAQRLTGFATRAPAPGTRRAGPVDLAGRDASKFPDYYGAIADAGTFEQAVRPLPRVVTGPVRYVGHDLVRRDIDNLKAALAGLGAEEAFLPAASPVPRWPTEFHASEDEYAAEFADAMREEYTAILDAGLVLQIDDPQMLSAWDSRQDLSLDDYRRLASRRVEIINHALRGLPQDRIRYHTCYGINFGPRVSDLELADLVDILLTIRVGAISFEAANPRHEHEWRLFADGRARVPDGLILIPGVVTHSNVMVEHPEVVADRIERWASAVGAENLIFGNDCGFASYAGNPEIPSTVAWAKLHALGEGARLATERLLHRN